MIIYGSNATELVTENVIGACSNCEAKNSIRMSVFQKYAHVFWIPFFSIGKTAATQCSHCKQVLSKEEFTKPLIEHYNTTKTNYKAPIWHFAGLPIVAILIAWGIISAEQNSENNAKMILNPQKGDVYGIKKGSDIYTLYKVANVVGDTAYLQIHQYETDQLSGLSKLKTKGDSAYSSENFPILKQNLKIMLEKGEIYDIDRK
jgi:hypothetical protein